MKLRLTLATAAFAVLSAALSAQAAEPAAQPNMPRVDKRQAQQEQRIEQGVASGQLNARETLRLEREQKHVASAEAKAEGDGKVTPKERARLARMQNKASHDIHHQKHDAQTAGK